MHDMFFMSFIYGNNRIIFMIKKSKNGVAVSNVDVQSLQFASNYHQMAV